jgi:hypothetical protein
VELTTLTQQGESIVSDIDKTAPAAALAQPEQEHDPAAAAEAAKDTRDFLHTEIERAGKGAAALLAGLSVLIPGAGAGFALVTNRGGTPAAAAVLGLAAVLLVGAFVSIIEVIRPRIPRRREDAAGWPLLLEMTSEQAEAHFRAASRDLARTYGDHAVVLARIARAKFRLVGRARAFILAALPVALAAGLLFALGV